MRTFAFLATLFLAANVLAADGDEVSPRESGRNLHYLCDSKVAADQGSTCSAFNVRARTAALNLYVSTDAGCTAYTVAIEHSTASSGDDWHTLGTLDFSGSTAIRVARFTGPWIRASLTTVTDCTDLDIKIEVDP